MPKIFYQIVLNGKDHLFEPPQPRPLTRHVSFLTRWMISPVLSTTSRLPLSLEFSEESSSTMRSGTAPVTRITSTWRRPATWVKEPEYRGVKRQPVDKTNLRWKGCNHNPQWAAPLWQLGHLQQQETSSASPLHHLLGNHQASLGAKSASWNHLHSYPSLQDSSWTAQSQLTHATWSHLFPLFIYSFTYSSDQIPGIVGNTKIKTRALLSGCAQSNEETEN